MVLNIITEPNPALHKAARFLAPEEVKSDEIQKLISDLFETMYEKEGVGLAAVQAGRPLHICVIAGNYAKDKKDLVLINPKIKPASIFKEWGEEGCLSVPDVYGKVKRRKKIKVTALDKTGQQINFTASDFFARIIQHETDHLNGILFIEKAKGLHAVEPRL